MRASSRGLDHVSAFDKNGGDDRRGVAGSKQAFEQHRSSLGLVAIARVLQPAYGIPA